MNTLIALLHSRAGALIQWLVGIVIGWLSSQFVAAGIEIPADSIHQLEMGLSALGAFIVTFAVQWYQARQAMHLQLVIGAKPDAWIGDQTIDTAKAVNAVAALAALKSTMK